MTAARYFHTLRYLKPVQLYGRVWRRLYRPALRPPAECRRRVPSGPWASPAPRRPSLLGPARFSLLNEAHDVPAASSWDDPAREKLWRYNLHYFDDLNAAGADSRAEWHRALIARWIAENPPAAGTGWEPYPTSLRIVNWIKHALAGHALGAAAEASLALQAHWLSQRIETHLLGNHLLSNAKALVFAGLFFGGKAADGWLRAGVDILRRELAEQILADGGHFERSPMYHALALEDVLDLVNLERAYEHGILAGSAPLAQAMCRWLAAMSHPDGEIAFFNDAATGIAPPPAALFEYAARLGVQAPGRPAEAIVHLRESGYVRLQSGDWLALYDAAPIGPDYLPGHAHADTLAFELSWRGSRVLCNSGTSRYGRSRTRDWERSTAAHNTLEIDGESSSEVWHGFRVARRAYPVGLELAPQAGKLRVSCAHDGYTRLSGRPIHRRTLEVAAQGVAWTDEVSGRGRHSAVGRIPLHPDVRAEALGERAWRLWMPGGEVLRLETISGPPLHGEAGQFSPEFGLTRSRTVLRWRLAGEVPFRVQFRLAAE